MVAARAAETAPKGRARMLDAAELLFAENGYDGTSVRDITRHAGVEVGLVTYHFKTKAELFRETLLRRAPDFAAALHAALDQVLLRDAQPAVAALFAAYLDAHVALVRSPDPGWRAYLQLAAEAMLRGSKDRLSDGATAVYRPVMDRYEHVLVRCAGRHDAAEVRRVWAIFRRTVLSILIGSADHSQSGDEQFAAMRQTCIDVFARALA
jgi:AcrR family transcriptional regulator